MRRRREVREEATVLEQRERRSRAEHERSLSEILTSGTDTEESREEELVLMKGRVETLERENGEVWQLLLRMLEEKEQSEGRDILRRHESYLLSTVTEQQEQLMQEQQALVMVMQEMQQKLVHSHAAAVKSRNGDGGDDDDDDDAYHCSLPSDIVSCKKELERARRSFFDHKETRVEVAEKYEEELSRLREVMMGVLENEEAVDRKVKSVLSQIDEGCVDNLSPIYSSFRDSYMAKKRYEEDLMERKLAAVALRQQHCDLHQQDWMIFASLDPEYSKVFDREYQPQTKKLPNAHRYWRLQTIDKSFEDNRWTVASTELYDRSGNILAGKMMASSALGVVDSRGYVKNSQGNPDGVWGRYYTSHYGGNDWFGVDLGEPAAACRLILRQSAREHGSNHFVIQYSDDAIAWTTVMTVQRRVSNVEEILTYEW